MDSNNIMENESSVRNNKKNNTFNLIIGVATLLIAILGATFAYFTMTNGSEENAVTVKSAFVSISYDGGTEVKADDLIPTNENVMLWAYQDPDKLSTTYFDEDDGENHTYQCIDAQGKKVCYVYQFTIRSDGDGDSTNIIGTITVNQNEFVEKIYDENNAVTGTKSGLSYMVFEITKDEEQNLVYDKVSPEVESSANQADIALYAGATEYKFARFGIPNEIDDPEDETGINKITQSVKNYLFGTDGHLVITNNVDHVFQLVIWLHDDNDNQNDEQAKNFAGTIKINVNSSDNTEGIVTGTRSETVTSEVVTSEPVTSEPVGE